MKIFRKKGSKTIIFYQMRTWSIIASKLRTLNSNISSSSSEFRSLLSTQASGAMKPLILHLQSTTKRRGFHSDQPRRQANSASKWIHKLSSIYGSHRDLSNNFLLFINEILSITTTKLQVRLIVKIISWHNNTYNFLQTRARRWFCRKHSSPAFRSHAIASKTALISSISFLSAAISSFSVCSKSSSHTKKVA